MAVASTSKAAAAATVAPAARASDDGRRRGWLRRRRNRRVTVARAPVTTVLAAAARALGRRLLFVAKVVAVIACAALSGLAGRQAVRQVIASPRFAVRDIRIGAATHVPEDEVRALAGVELGDRLLAVDPDAVARRLASHPWIASARVRRELPSTLAIEISERRAVASALLGALYLLDEGGRPFKRATFEEADGLPVITGVTREQYAGVRGASEAVFREAIALVQAYTAEKHRPRISEVHADPRAGFTLVLLDGAGEVRLGRGEFSEKLARFDRIVAALGPSGPASLAVVYLDGQHADRVTVRLRSAGT